MKITIHVPAGDRVVDYVRLVADQLEDDYTSGHVDQDTHWTVEFEPVPKS